MRNPALQAALEYRKAELIKLATELLGIAQSVDSSSESMTWGHAGDFGRMIELTRRATEIGK